MRRSRVFFALAFGTLLLSAPVAARSSAGRDEGSRALVTANATLRASLTRIAERSPLWRDAIASLRRVDRRVVVLTPDQVIVADQPGGVAKEAFDPTVLAEVAPVPFADSRVDVVLVVINLRLLEETHRGAGSVLSEFEADLDRILIHEVYGHAVPYLLAGHLSGRCPDPAPGDRVLSACSVRRENAVRAELGLGRRATYGLDELNLARRARR